MDEGMIRDSDNKDWSKDGKINSWSEASLHLPRRQIEKISIVQNYFFTTVVSRLSLKPPSTFLLYHPLFAHESLSEV